MLCGVLFVCLLSLWLVNRWYKVLDDLSWGHLDLLKEPAPQKKTLPYRFPIDSLSSGFPIGKIENHLQQIKAQELVLSQGQVSIAFSSLDPRYPTDGSHETSWTCDNFHPLQTLKTKLTLFLFLDNLNQSQTLLNLPWNVGNVLLCFGVPPLISKCLTKNNPYMAGSGTFKYIKWGPK